MKRIVSKRDKERKDSRNKVIVGLVLVGIMIMGTVGYAFYGRTEDGSKKIVDGGVEFVLGDTGLWHFEVQGMEFLTQYTIKDTKNISMFIFKTATDYSAQPLFFIGKGEAKQELIRNLRNFIPRIQDGCIEDYEEKCEENAPMKNCSQDNIIIIEEANETKISQEDNCILIEAPYEEQVRVADAFLFKILGLRGH